MAEQDHSLDGKTSSRSVEDDFPNGWGEIPIIGSDSVALSLEESKVEENASHLGLLGKARSFMQERSHIIRKAKVEDLEVIACATANGRELRVGKGLIASMGGVAAVLTIGGIILYPRIRPQIIKRVFKK